MRIRLYIVILVMSLLTPLVMASQEKDIYLDTGGKLGRLIYMEQYYSVDGSNLTLDQGRAYFDGNINSSRITFLIIRPLDKQGNQYPENQIRALATLDNVTILNTWYGNSSPLTNVKSQDNVQTIGFENAPLIGLITIVAVLLLLTYLIKKLIHKMKNKEESNDITN